MKWSLVPWLVLVVLVSSRSARGEAGGPSPRRDVSRLRVRASVGGALLVSPDQTGVLGFQGTGVEIGAELGYAVRPWLQPTLGLLGGVFPADQGGAGGLLAPLAGLRFGISGAGHPVYAAIEVGPALTGPRVRPLLRLGAGADFEVSRGFTLGPRLGYLHVRRPREPNATSGASAVELTLCLGYRPTREPSPQPEPPPPPVVIEHERVRWVPAPEPPPPPPQPSEDLMRLIERAVPASRVELLAPVLFRFDSDELQPLGVAMLHEVANVLKQRQDIRLVEIQGYADARGSSEYNAQLSERRAERVRAWLVAHGVEAERLTVAGRGASDPVEAGDAEPAHLQNRRVVFRVLRTEGP